MNIRRANVWRWMLAFAAMSASAQGPDLTPPTPLLAALLHDDTKAVKKLLDQGANPNEGRFGNVVPPLVLAVMHQNLELVRALAAKGADVNARDVSGSTALMWAASNEHGRTDIAAELLYLGAEPNARNQKGETALALASRRGSTGVVAMLKRAGASDRESVQQAAEKAIALLQKSSQQFVRVSGCVSCHHQSLPQMAIGIARERGVAVDEGLAHQQLQAAVAVFSGMQKFMLTSKDRIPDPAIGLSYGMIGLAADRQPSGELTDAMASLVSQWQTEEGKFLALPARPPMESSDFTATALSIRALQLYGKQPQQSIERAAQWLSRAVPRNTEEGAMQLLGLTWAKAPAAQIRKSAQTLLAEQNADGGWSQLPNLESDAYATGQALTALALSGGFAAPSEAQANGIGYLLRTQFADGSWHVRTRTYVVQPLKDSGFPHGNDQWISAAGTSWATMALSLSLPVKSAAR